MRGWLVLAVLAFVIGAGALIWAWIPPADPDPRPGETRYMSDGQIARWDEAVCVWRRADGDAHLSFVEDELAWRHHDNCKKRKPPQPPQPPQPPEPRLLKFGERP